MISRDPIYKSEYQCNGENTLNFVKIVTIFVMFAKSLSVNIGNVRKG